MHAAATPELHRAWLSRMQAWVAAVALAALAIHFGARLWMESPPSALVQGPLLAALAAGVLLLHDLAKKLLAGQLSSDLLAGASIMASVLLGEYLVGTIIVLMLAGGTALEGVAAARASSALAALARRMPSIAHRRTDSGVEDVPLEQVRLGDRLLIYPHEVCPADGAVIEGHGVMDESYLTGEPFLIPKAPGAAVLSGAVNQDTPLEIIVEKLPRDSRYAQIMRVMEQTEQQKPQMRRLADRLGAWYTPVALAAAAAGWALSGDPKRFLAVLVIATPCPLLIAIPVAIVGAISLAARRGIVVKNPVLLEQIGFCQTWIFDKTGTLTYGRPVLTEIFTAEGYDARSILWLASSLEQYSKHPLAGAIRQAAEAAGLGPAPVTRLSERPGQGLEGIVNGDRVKITGRDRLPPNQALPPPGGGLECVVLIGERYAATLRFRDEPRAESRPFLAHLRTKHRAAHLILVSGDRNSEAEYLASVVGISEVHAPCSPEQKVAIVAREAARAPSLFVGDGVNDAPAMYAATVAVALGIKNEITAEAGDAVVLEPTLRKVDELVHIGERMRRIALQSALGGMLLSIAGMALAVVGILPPLAGAVGQELIDLAAVLNALRVPFPRKELSDF